MFFTNSKRTLSDQPDILIFILYSPSGSFVLDLVIYYGMAQLKVQVFFVVVYK